MALVASDQHHDDWHGFELVSASFAELAGGGKARRCRKLNHCADVGRWLVHQRIDRSEQTSTPGLLRRPHILTKIEDV
jgi:hypothetical protein